ncbi:MAG: response regulator [Betaproteobacteria bacterium]|nr:response regulator [Betaproteobacteria bacterium]
MRILVAEDDPTLRKGLFQVLGEIGHTAVTVADGDHADLLLATEPFDLVVLDLGLPRMDGLTVLERLRRRRLAVPVLILSARDQIRDKVRGLDFGADDYMTKPFDLTEFEARVRALLRRGHANVVRVGLLDWSWETREATVGNCRVTLSRHEVGLLEALVQSPGRIVSKETLSLRLGEDGAPSTSNLVEVYVHRLRRKLASAQVEIRTIRGLGYRIEEAREVA